MTTTFLIFTSCEVSAYHENFNAHGNARGSHFHFSRLVVRFRRGHTRLLQEWPNRSPNTVKLIAAELASVVRYLSLSIGAFRLQEVPPALSAAQCGRYRTVSDGIWGGKKTGRFDWIVYSSLG